jgi:hypothetical protein
MRICTITIVGGLHRVFFCSDATLVQKICSDISCEISDKITSPEKIATMLQWHKKKCSDVSDEVSGKIRSILLRTFFATTKQKWGFFLLHGSNFEILVRNIFAPFIQFFCYDEPFSAALVHYRSKSGIEGV